MVRHTSLKKWGTSSAVVIPKQIRDAITWRSGDSIAIRIAGDKLILERIPLENLAILRTGIAEAHK